MELVAARSAPGAPAVSDYFEMTKPRVQSLLLFTTVTTMYVAGDPSLDLVALTCLGGALSAGGAGAINHVLDRDIDRAMPRTANRPVAVRTRLARRAALAFGIAARRAPRSCCWPRPSTRSRPRCRCPGLLGYVFVYTLWLKRSTPQNIVIGGAAGAVPPLVAWAAVTGGLTGTPLYLFAIIFFWTPPHFWSLSLLMKDEYARAGVPMLPVVRGERETRRQILLYTVLLVRGQPAALLRGCVRRDLPRRVGAPRRGVHLRRGPAREPAGAPHRAAPVPVLARLPRGAVRRDGGRRPAVARAAARSGEEARGGGLHGRARQRRAHSWARGGRRARDPQRGRARDPRREALARGLALARDRAR